MRVDIAILPEPSTRNTVSRLVWGLHRQYRIGLRGDLLDLDYHLRQTIDR